MCPKPPMPTTPTRLVGLAYIISGLKTVMPPHSSGPASAKLVPSGNGMAQAQCERTRRANPPRWPTIVDVDSAAQVLIARHHCRQCMQLPAVQPTPTLLPTLRPLVAGPTSTTRPTSRAPARPDTRKSPVIVQNGKIGVAQAAVLDRHFHFFSPDGPSSICCRTNFFWPSERPRRRPWSWQFSQG